MENLEKAQQNLSELIHNMEKASIPVGGLKEVYKQLTDGINELKP